MSAQHSPRHWHILGTGSMACLWAAYLSLAGPRVMLIGRTRRLEKEYHGIRLRTALQMTQHLVELEAMGDTSPIQRLLVCTKAYDVLEALDAIAPRLTPRACVVLLQNGMGFHDAALRRIAPARLFCALTTEGAHCPVPFHVQHAGTGRTWIGAYGPSPRGSSGRLRTELPLRYLNITALATIEPALWRKFALNCAINALTAVHGCRNGELLASSTLRAEFTALCAEITAILNTLGYPALAATLRADAESVARATAANRSSMLQDVSNGRRTEIDFINGYLWQRAREMHVPAPLNQRLCERVRALEGCAIGPRFDH